VAKSQVDRANTWLDRLTLWGSIASLIALVITGWSLWPANRIADAKTQKGAQSQIVNVNVTTDGNEVRATTDQTLTEPPRQAESASVDPAESAQPESSVRFACQGDTEPIRQIVGEAIDYYQQRQWQRALERYRCAYSKLPLSMKRQLNQRELRDGFALQNPSIDELAEAVDRVHDEFERLKDVLKEEPR
jgi:hypothetical protein